MSRSPGSARGGRAERVRDIFEPFVRLHDRSRYPGSGIGLATCRRIVEAHGGRIWAEPREFEGSLFRFTLPAAPPSQDSPEDLRRPGQPPVRA